MDQQLTLKTKFLRKSIHPTQRQPKNTNYTNLSLVKRKTIHTKLPNTPSHYPQLGVDTTRAGLSLHHCSTQTSQN